MACKGIKTKCYLEDFKIFDANFSFNSTWVFPKKIKEKIFWYNFLKKVCASKKLLYFCTRLRKEMLWAEVTASGVSKLQVFNLDITVVKVLYNEQENISAIKEKTKKQARF